MSNPYICDCENYIDKLLDGLDKNIYNVKATNTNLYKIIDTYNKELCDAYADLILNKNDIYLGVTVTNEVVIHGEQHGIDCLANWAVVEVISVGDTPGASDYLEDIDFIINERGLEWDNTPEYYGSYPYGYGYGHPFPYSYGYYWGQYYNPWSPHGRKEPVTGDTYYVTYKYGCRNTNLYNNFGALVDLKKISLQTYLQYRNAIKVLILAYLGGPTKANIQAALSVFHPSDLILIEEGYFEGWYLGENILYSESTWGDSSVDTSDGTILRDALSGLYEWQVTFFESWRINDNLRVILENLIDDMKPAHTKVIIIYA